MSNATGRFPQFLSRLGNKGTVQRAQYVLSSPRPQAVLRPLRWPLYDTEYLASGAGSTSLIFFQKPQGQTTGAITKTAAHTNLTASGQLGVPNEFDLYGFRLNFWMYESSAADYAPSTIADEAMIQIARHLGFDGVFSFLFGTQRPWIQVPCYMIPTGSSIHVEGSQAVTNNIVQAQYGDTTVNSFYNFTIRRRPLRIRSSESFSVKIEFPTLAFSPTHNVMLQVVLVGVHYVAL